jgi:hypothetical protein
LINTKRAIMMTAFLAPPKKVPCNLAFLLSIQLDDSAGNSEKARKWQQCKVEKAATMSCNWRRILEDSYLVRNINLGL